MKRPFLGLLLAAPFALTLAASGDAQACGGCFAPPEVNTIVNSHRMALSVSPKQTVLWDQIRYSGDPESWAWILPVKPGAVVELSTDAWFETLDAATTATVFAPPISCNSGPDFDCGCGSSADSAGSGGEFGGGNDVTVVHRGTVGPFETVTLSTETPGVLDDWLTTAGYAIPADAAPIIDAYVDEGFDFIALKLQPNKGVDEMKPVRIVQPGAVPTLPLRMVAIGAGPNVAVTLFVISEGRWSAKNFKNTEVPVDLLSWDFADQSSNYAPLREKVLAENGGATWLTTFARPKVLLSTFNRAVTGQLFFGFDANFNAINTLAAGYVKQGVANGEATDEGCIPSFAKFADSTFIVSDPCPAGKSSVDPSCGVVAAGEIDARQFECGAVDAIETATLDDISSALTGLHPNDVWVTRMEANLPRAALANDLVLEPAAAQVDVENEVRARQATNIESFCPSGVILPPGSPRDRGTFIVVAAVLGAALAGLARRRTRVARIVPAT
jgi:hypothetical protein